MMETRNTSTAETKCSPDDVIRIKTTIVENFRELIARGPDERLCWTGTQCDLIELAHIVWETGSLRDKRGLPMGFRTIVERICTTLHCVVPRNPSTVIGRIRTRKNIRVCPVLERYLYLLSRQSIAAPMWLDIRYCCQADGHGRHRFAAMPVAVLIPFPSPPPFLFMPSLFKVSLCNRGGVDAARQMAGRTGWHLWETNLPQPGPHHL